MAAEVYAAKCKGCGHLSYPTHYYCPSCGGTKFDAEPIVGEGRLLTWTREYALSLDYAVRYITLGIAELDMGIRATGKIDIEEPEVGMKVRTEVGKVREILGDDIKGLVFKAA